MAVITAHSDAARIVAHAPAPAANALILGIGYQAALLLVSAAAAMLDDRLIDGVSVWSKPLKFELSIILLLATVLALLPLLSRQDQQRRSIRWPALAMSFAGVAEISYIVVQAARGRASHFNQSTPLESAAYSLMGAGALVLVVTAFVIGYVIWRRARPEAGAGLILGAASGLMLGAVLTLVTASLLSSGAVAEPGHWVGGMRSDADGLWLLGWSRTGGDLRVPHFFATHAMQALPLLGLLADRMMPHRARPIVWGGMALSILVVTATFAQAMMARPFI